MLDFILVTNAIDMLRSQIKSNLQIKPYLTSSKQSENKCFNSYLTNFGINNTSMYKNMSKL